MSWRGAAMKVGIVGLPCTGKTTVFNALTDSLAEVSVFQGGRRDPNLAVVKVPDPRLDFLAAMYRPDKVTAAQVQYVDVGGSVGTREGSDASTEDLLRLLRPVDALVHVVRNFSRAGEPPMPQRDLEAFESELILADLITVERRLERLEKDSQKGKKGDPGELDLLSRAKSLLDKGHALRARSEIAQASLLKGYALLSAKPCIVVLNSGDDAELGATALDLPEGAAFVELKGQLEMELAQLGAEEAGAFREDLGLTEPAVSRLIRECYQLLGLISFFTVGEDEVRAWTIRRDTPAQKAAGAIHSDMDKGFIRAEVVAYDDLAAAGSYAGAQKAGKVRLEGKEYTVKDGDVVNVRFNL